MSKANELLNRYYIAVPYSERSLAMAEGATFDPERKCWYVTQDQKDSEALSRWEIKSRTHGSQDSSTPEEGFADFLAVCGAVIENGELPTLDGNKHRIAVEGDSPGKKSGLYVGFDDAEPAGYFKNYKTGDYEPWSHEAPKRPLEEINAIRANNEIRSILREEEKRSLHLQVASKQQNIWSKAEKANKDHPYLVSKSSNVTGRPLPAFVARQDKYQNLLIPLHDASFKIWSLQRINENGDKSIKQDSKSSGMFCLINPEAFKNRSTANIVLVAESYGTGAALADATSYPVFSAVSAYNLDNVARILKANYPEKTIFIAGDDDHKPEKVNEADYKNIGVRAAKVAASSVNTVPIFPVPEDGIRRKYDFADMYQDQGKEAVDSHVSAHILKHIGKDTNQNKSTEPNIQKKAPSKVIKAPSFERGV